MLTISPKPLILFASLVLLTSCGSTPTIQKKPDQKPVQTVKITPLEQPDALLPEQPVSTPSRADLVNSAQFWIDESRFAPFPERQDLLLRSTAALLKAVRLAEAKQILDAIDVSGLPTQYSERKRLLRIQLSLAQGKLELASRYLARYRRSRDLDPEFRTQALALSAQAYMAENNTTQALHELIRREQYLTDLTGIRENRERIWRVLGTTDPIHLQIERQSTTNIALGGWLDLALLFNDFGTDPQRLRQTLTDWVQINPLGSAQVYAGNILQMSGPPAYARGAPILKIALLLPLASKFGAAAQAVYDGFEAMRILDSNPLKPEVVVYDVGEVAELATSYYQLAIDEGANLIVGPLGKQAATAIINNRLTSSVPTILLGGISQNNTLPINTYQIDLAPEQEATQVATRAFFDGHRVAAVLRPNSEWGQRVSLAFTNQWQSLGGIIVNTQTYNEASNDHSFAIKEMLNLNTSEGRKSALSVKLNTKIDFRPRRRQDLDIVFLVSRPVAGRLIKPQINFYQAHDIPVYSTSHIYSGIRDIVNDTDLNQVIFGDMPWLLLDDNRSRMLHESVESQTHPRGSLERLFALGMDAYLLSQVIPYLEGKHSLLLKGVSGDRLRLDENGHIQRQLTWARFDEGAPSVLDYTEGTDSYENIQPDENRAPGATSGVRPASGTASLPVPY